MSAADDYFDFERPDADQLLFEEPKTVMAANGGIVLLATLALSWYWSRPGSAWHAGAASTKLGIALFVLMMLALAGLLLYGAIVGRSILIDGKAKLVLKNGERLASFGGIRSVELAIGYHPSILIVGGSYALSLRLKSGERVPVIGMRWLRWFEQPDGDTDYQDDRRDEHASQALDELAQEVAALIGVAVSKPAG